MANMTSNGPQNDINQCGQSILRAKTTLIKPYSKVNIKLLEFKLKYSFSFIDILH